MQCRSLYFDKVMRHVKKVGIEEQGKNPSFPYDDEI